MTRAIVRGIPESYSSCVSDHPQHHLLSRAKAREQHAAYVNLLRELGLEVIELQPLAGHPDCCFVEDTAVIHGDRAVITRMGEPSRRGEVDTIESILREHFEGRRIEDPGTLEGGDVMHLGNRLVSGVTTRTNIEGVNQLRDWIRAPVDVVEDGSIVHLKSYATPLSDTELLVTGKYRNHPAFDGLTKIVVPDEESYAANSLTVEGVTVMPSGYRQTKALLEELGKEVATLDMTEFEKCEGALTCLSLIF